MTILKMWWFYRGFRDMMLLFMQKFRLPNYGKHLRWLMVSLQADTLQKYIWNLQNTRDVIFQYGIFADNKNDDMKASC